MFQELGHEYPRSHYSDNHSTILRELLQKSKSNVGGLSLKIVEEVGTYSR